MSKSDVDIVIENPNAPMDGSPVVVGIRGVETMVMLILVGFSSLMAVDNWRTGMSWAEDGPEAGYFPFYLSIILLFASIYGVLFAVRPDGARDGTFLTRDQLRRVSQVFLPTVAFCVAIQWLGLYVASFLLISSFMWMIGRIALWKCVLTALLFSAIMFATFEIAFGVIMPKGPLEALLGY